LFSKKNVGKAEISLRRSLFYDWSENDIIEYILTKPISTKHGKYNMSYKPGRAVYDYQNMDIWIGRHDGSESDLDDSFEEYCSKFLGHNIYGFSQHIVRVSSSK
jgi:hypothetical protein